MSSYPVHPLANLIPEMNEEDYLRLREDINQNKLHDPVCLFNGQIVDGRHRAKACMELGVDIPTREFEGTEEEILDFVISMNLARRHLRESQRAMVAARVAEELRKSPNLHSGDLATAASVKLSIGRSSVMAARKVLRQCAPAVVNAVEAGIVAVSDATALTGEPNEKQEEVIRRIESGEVNTVKQARRDPNDYYPTPAWVTEALLAVHPPPVQEVTEPSAGDGSIVAVLTRHNYNVHAIELRMVCRAALEAAGSSKVTIGDALAVLSDISIGAIIGNPPFAKDLGFEFVRACVATGAPYVAMLLQLDFFSSRPRAEWNNEHTVTGFYPLGDRPSFTGDGRTDGRNYAWFVWETGKTLVTPRVLLKPGGGKGRRKGTQNGGEHEQQGVDAEKRS